MVGYNMDGPAKDKLMRIIQEKDRLESDIRQQNMILESNNVGMQDPLVDSQGYPRGDIDVYKVRHARHSIICLQNDHKNIMKQIEQGLGELHAEFKEVAGSSSHQNGSRNPLRNANITSNHPHPTYTNGHGGNGASFAVIGFVQEGSPADLAGLTEKDEVLQFGSINSENFRDITQVNEVVGYSVEQPIQVKVKRGHLVLGLTVVPRRWDQPGLLGCQIRKLP